MNTQSIIKKSLAGEMLSAGEIRFLFEMPLFSTESAMILAAGREKSEQACGGKAEVHAQIGLNVASCRRNCKFCAFAEINHVFNGSCEISAEQAIAEALEFEADGANAIFLMTTADYPFSKYIELSGKVCEALKPETPLVANVGDFSLRQAEQLKQAGFCGIYHAVRLGEGTDTTIPPEKRLRTFDYAMAAGLKLGTCLEPVGPEHAIDELVEKTIITRDAFAVFSGAARRIPIPQTEMAKFGKVSEARLAHIVAVVRLALGYDVPGNCTHEPNVISAAAGANLLWAEVGSNPRDTEAETKNKRGMTVCECRQVLEEAEWDVLDGPSVFYGDAKQQTLAEAKQLTADYRSV